MEEDELTVDEIRELLTQEHDEQGLNASPSISLGFVLLQMVDAHQAKIDALMLEYCPEEMTKAQMTNWAIYQIPQEDE